jgi:hypothetical protein
MHGSRSKIPSKKYRQQHCVEGFNSGLKGLMHFWIYTSMFWQVIAFIRGSWFPQKLLKQSVLWMYVDYDPLMMAMTCQNMLG